MHILMKILEHLVHSQLMSYCNSNNLINHAQSGFRKGHSTQSSLLRLTEHVFEYLKTGKIVGMVALDLKKAFDTVNREILLRKLNHYGIIDTENSWFRDCLTNRLQKALINGHPSDSKLVETGVPQGSILGPLLFIIYVNDMPSCLNHSEVDMYADDTAFYYGSSNIDDVKSHIQADLARVYD